MYKKFTQILLICVFLFTTNGRAQEAVSSNGKFATIDGLKVYYEESGKGVPVILLHHFFSTASLWNKYIPELSQKYRVIAVDLPGHGRSGYMDTTRYYLHKTATKYIIGLIEYLKLDSVYLMGASSGGSISLQLAILKPELVKRLIVLGGHIYYPKEQRVIVANWRKTPDSASLARHGKEKAELLQKQFLYFSQLYGDPSYTPDMLSTIRAKTLIIHGDNDKLAPISNAWGMYENIPGAFLWIVPNGGHFPFPPYIDPVNTKDFVKRTLEFLNGDWDKN